MCTTVAVPVTILSTVCRLAACLRRLACFRYVLAGRCLDCLLCSVLQGSPVAGPGGLDPQGARMRQQLVPAPERIWALRNVANSMLKSTASSGGGGTSGSSTPSAEEAVSMLKQASDLAAEHYGKSHPGGVQRYLWLPLLAVPMPRLMQALLAAMPAAAC